MEHKSGNISETRKDRGKDTMEVTKRSFEWYHPRPPTASPSPRLGVRKLPQKSKHYYLRNGYSYGLQIWPIHSQGPSEHKPMKNFGEKGAWGIQLRPKFFEYPLLSQERAKLRTSNLAGTCIHGVHAKKSPLKFERKGSVGVSRDCQIFFQYPYYLRNG